MLDNGILIDKRGLLGISEEVGRNSGKSLMKNIRNYDTKQK
jgi:hypothetical protein